MCTAQQRLHAWGAGCARGALSQLHSRDGTLRGRVPADPRTILQGQQSTLPQSAGLVLHPGIMRAAGAGAAEQQLDSLRLAALGLIAAACSWEAFRTTRTVAEPGSQAEQQRCAWACQACRPAGPGCLCMPHTSARAGAEQTSSAGLACSQRAGRRGLSEWREMRGQSEPDSRSLEGGRAERAAQVHRAHAGQAAHARARRRG